MRRLPSRSASTAWPSALFSLCAPVCSRSSRLRYSRLSGANLSTRVVGLEPRQVDDGADVLVASQQVRVARAMAVLARVELHEIGVGRLALADEDGDAQHRLGRSEQRVGPTRALLREDEADDVRSR